jgi:hypothetical protein
MRCLQKIPISLPSKGEDDCLWLASQQSEPPVNLDFYFLGALKGETLLSLYRRLH